MQKQGEPRQSALQLIIVQTRDYINQKAARMHLPGQSTAEVVVKGVYLAMQG